MEEILARFPIVGQKIFKELDDKSLAKSRETSKVCCQFLDNNSLLWKRRILRFTKNQFKIHETWKMVTNCVPIEFLRKLTIAGEKYYKMYPWELDYHNSPLHIAAYFGMFECCRYIMKRTKLMDPGDEI